MSRARTGYTVRPYTRDDEPVVLGLIERCLQGGPTGRRTAEFFRWKHESSPFGRSFAFVAEEAGEIIGFRTFMRWRFLSGGAPIEAVRAVDTATHPDHQGRGIFTRLTRTALDAIRDEVGIVFNTPNASSGPGYLKMGWSPVGTIPIAIRPVRPVRVLRNAVSARRGGEAHGGPPLVCPLPTANSVLADDTAVSDLLARTGDRDQRLTTERSVAYLRWRYGDAPDLDYRALAITAGGALTGLALGRPRRRGRGSEFLLSEVIVAEGDDRTARRLLRAATRSACDRVVAHLPAKTGLPSAGLATGYLPVPSLGVNLVANPLHPSLQRALAIESWRLCLGDIEVF